MPVFRKDPVSLPDNPEWIERWERRLDPKRTSIKQFIELFKVPSKNVLPGEPAMKQFVEYDFQAAWRQTIEDQWARGEGGKTLGGKPRQGGETTGKVLVAWERFMRAGGGTWNYFSYDDDHSIEAFSLFVKLKRQVPAWVYAFLVNESEPGAYDGGGFWTKNSHRQLELSFPGAGGASLVQCATAGGDHSGSGSAPRGVFCDEIYKWTEAAKADHTGISEGWADVPGNIFAKWGTGNGRETEGETFIQHYRNPHLQDDGYVAQFTNWLGHPDRRATFADALDRQRFAESVGKMKKYGPREEVSLLGMGATLEELKWRRRKLSDPNFKLDVQKWNREYPTVAEDMFLSESGTVFQVGILKTHDAAAAARELRARVGDFVESGDDVVFVPNASGSWTLYEERRDDMVVCWGADSASGKSRQAGSGKEADHADGKFKELYSGRTVARFDGHLEGRKFGEEMLNAARYYRFVMPKKKDDAPREMSKKRRRRRNRAGAVRFAQGFPEVNNESGMAMMMGMERYCQERDLDFFDFVMMQLHPVLSDGKRPDPSPGWRTSRSVSSGGVASGSKGILIDTTKLFVADTGDFDPAKGTPFDSHTLGQMYRYERDERGATEAASGFDDAVSSEMLCLVARDYLISGMAGSLPRLPKASAAPRMSHGPKMRYYPDQDWQPPSSTDPVARMFQYGPDAETKEARRVALQARIGRDAQAGMPGTDSGAEPAFASGDRRRKVGSGRGRAVGQD